ncbi:MAG: putative FAD-dependent oxidoreductase, partial [Armatimonadetes bacterium]|nr:putative FAD-dependent oxidoreductase [Armatimonadota bacterium]
MGNAAERPHRSPLLPHSTTPTPHYSITPLLHHPALVAPPVLRRCAPPRCERPHSANSGKRSVSVRTRAATRCNSASSSRAATAAAIRSAISVMSVVRMPRVVPGGRLAIAFRNYGMRTLRFHPRKEQVIGKVLAPLHE